VFGYTFPKGVFGPTFSKGGVEIELLFSPFSMGKNKST